MIMATFFHRIRDFPLSMAIMATFFTVAVFNNAVGNFGKQEMLHAWPWHCPDTRSNGWCGVGWVEDPRVEKNFNYENIQIVVLPHSHPYGVTEGEPGCGLNKKSFGDASDVKREWSPISWGGAGKPDLKDIKQ